MTLELHSARLVIRSIIPEDWCSIFEYMSDENVTRWLPEGKFTEITAREFAERNSGNAARALAVIERQANRFLGHMVFHPVDATRTHEIGWVIHQSEHGNGYASEAASALLKHAFSTLDCHRVIATCQPENIASWRVMEKIGMRREGLLLQCIHRGGETWWDEYVYAILKSEFLAQQSS